MEKPCQECEACSPVLAIDHECPRYWVAVLQGSEGFQKVAKYHT